MTRVIFLFLLAVSAPVTSQNLFDTPWSQRTANYDITAELLPDSKAVKASWVLNWKNSGTQPATELQFHLYLNAFKNEKSTFIRESGGRHRSGIYEKSPMDWGYVDVHRLQITGGEDLTGRIEYIQPDDGNTDDQTVIRVPLATPVRPGESIRLECDFYSKLPRAFARTGFSENDFFMIAQWFPKIGVWKDEAWNCHQFHSNSEFYADFGVYTMQLTVPKRFKVGAGAVLQNKTSTDSSDTYFYRQEDVIDAVWTAYPHYTEIKQTVPVRISGRTVEVTYLLAPGRESLRDRYFSCVDSMFNYFEEWFGPYPYSNLTIVDPPIDDEMTVGGMEYPTLITTGGFFQSEWTTDFLGLHWLEIVTFHEFAHNYFQSMVASNEFEEPWLDEGFTSYAEHKALNRYFGPARGYGSIQGMPISSVDYHRASYLANPRGGVMPGKAWEIPSNFYQTAAYSKPVLVLATLEELLGPSRMKAVMRTYVERWRFNHPTTADFETVVAEVGGQDVAWFFKQYVYGDETVDLAVGGIGHSDFTPDEGWFGEGGEKVFSSGDEANKSDSVVYSTRARIYNRGTGTFPTEILIRFSNGDTTLLLWDGASGQTMFEFRDKPRISSVQIDPFRKNLLDLNISNNERYTEAEITGLRRYTIRFLFWLQTLLQFVMSIF